MDAHADINSVLDAIDNVALLSEPTPLGDLSKIKIPRREWLIFERLIPGYVTGVVGQGGSNKTTLALTEAVAVVTGRPLTDHRVDKTGNVWIINLEDDRDEMHRRLLAICLKNAIDPATLADKVFLDAGADQNFAVVTETSHGVVASPNVKRCIQHIKKHEISLLIVDPFVRAHGVSENDNRAMDAVIQQFSKIAQATGCAISLVHHTGKLNGRDIAGDADAGRGASAFVNALRVCHTITVMSGKDAETLGIPEAERLTYVRLDRSKANLLPPATSASWFHRVGVDLDNGDNVGVLEIWDAPRVETMNDDRKTDFVELVEQRWREGNPLASAPNSARYAVNAMDQVLGIPRAAGKKLLKEVIASGLVKDAFFDKRNKQRGLIVNGMDLGEDN